jgi:hypothetical protein
MLGMRAGGRRRMLVPPGNWTVEQVLLVMLAREFSVLRVRLDSNTVKPHRSEVWHVPAADCLLLPDSTSRPQLLHAAVVKGEAAMLGMQAAHAGAPRELDSGAGTAG